MKKILLALVALLLMSNLAQATHMLGGEVRWVCLPNGKFIFFLDIYKDCSTGAAGFSFVNQQLNVVGSPLPRNSNNATVSQITMKPDSNRWVNANNGDITPKCQNPNGLSYSCANGDEGAVQWFPFQSDPIQLKGTPPANGWTFIWGLCCRPPVVNLQNPQSKSMGLRATMYRIPNPNGTTPAYLPVDVCQDSSPEFAERPANQICRGYEFTYNHNARDAELDSLVYSFDDPIENGSGPNFQKVSFANGYGTTNPLPDQNFNSSNVPVTLNPLTGEMKQAVYNGSGALSYNTVIRVDAWRCGQVIASIWRDIPFVFFDCSPLPNGKKNNPPQILIDGIPLTNYSLEVFAGEAIKIGFQSVDNDLNPTFSPPFQRNILEPTGFLFSKNFADPTFCETNVIRPCATLSPPPVQTPGNPYQLSQLSGVSTEFNWQTDCNHISVVTGGQCGNATGQVGAANGIFNFVMKTYDDNCPIRAINYPTITVKVKAPIPVENPIVKGASVGLDGKTTVNWVPPLDSANTFEAYDIDGATVNNGVGPAGSYITVQPLINNYKQEKTFQYLNFPINLYTPFPGGKDYYFRMISYSGCTGDIPSAYSEPVRIMELEATNNGPAPFQNSAVKLDWNRPKPVNAATNPNFIYESQTRFYIYENVEAANNASLTDPSKWTLVGNTYGTTFTKGSSVCNDLVAFRVEAKDTIITFAQGVRINSANPVYDTLVFSTFSIIDAMQMQAAGSVTAPTLDSLEVLNNGDVFFKIDLASSPIAGTFEFYSVSGGTRTLLGSVNAPNSTFTHVGANANQANTVVTDYEVDAINRCNPSDIITSATINPITPLAAIVSAGTGNPCDELLEVNWGVPVGMVNNNITYKVFQKIGTGTFVQVAGGLTNTKYTLPTFAGDTDYEFYVIAENADGDISISEVTMISIPQRPSEEVLPAPNVRCVSVLDDGSVRIEWTPWDDKFDSTNTFRGYRFRYRVAGSASWLPSNSGTIPNNLVKTDLDFIYTGLNAQNQQYELEVATLREGCTGILETAAQFQTIFLGVTANTDKSGDLTWNSTGISSLNDYEIWRDEDANSGYNKELKFFTQNQLYTDNTNGDACGVSVYYFVRKQDDILGCTSQSNIADDFFDDVFDPDGQLLDYATVSRSDSLVFIRWSDPVADDVDRLIFIRPNVNGGYDSIGGSTFNPSTGKTYSFPLSELNGNDSAATVWVQAVDGCGNVGNPDFDNHTTMFLQANWNPCDSLVELSWNPYKDFHNGTGVEYRILFDSVLTDVWDNTLQVPNGLGVTTDTTFDFKIGKDFPVNRKYHFYVLATQTGSGANSFQRSRSNRINVDVIFEGTPRYTYSHYVNVLDENQVELQVYPDQSVSSTIGQFVIYRGLYKTELSALGSVSNDDVVGPTFRYYDYSAATNENSYFYRVVVENKCGGPVDTSNWARSIHLKVQADNEALTNTLRWNEYEGWDSTVAFYNIYRSYNNGGFELYKVVPPVEQDEMNGFVDDVYGEITAVGDFCYMVEAVQGPVTTDFGIDQDLNPAISRSNEVCVIQEPLFYIPNAFAPKGVNRLFGPQGQFVNWGFYEMIIYNRWGETVFETNDPTEGWDGKVNGKDSQVGSYVYTIRFIDAEGNERRRKGTVTIIQ